MLLFDFLFKELLLSTVIFKHLAHLFELFFFSFQLLNELSSLLFGFNPFLLANSFSHFFHLLLGCLLYFFFDFRRLCLSLTLLDYFRLHLYITLFNNIWLDLCFALLVLITLLALIVLLILFHLLALLYIVWLNLQGTFLLLNLLRYSDLLDSHNLFLLFG